MDKFKAADAIVAGGAVRQKVSVFKELAANDCTEAGLLAQERMIEICSKGLYGEKPNEKEAMDYARALTNQNIDIAKRIMALEVLGSYYKRAGESVSAELKNKDEIIGFAAIEAARKDNFAQAIQCFQRAHDVYPDKENKDRLTNEIRSINQLLAQRE